MKRGEKDKKVKRGVIPTQITESAPFPFREQCTMNCDRNKNGGFRPFTRMYQFLFFEIRITYGTSQGESGSLNNTGIVLHLAFSAFLTHLGLCNSACESIWKIIRNEGETFVCWTSFLSLTIQLYIWRKKLICYFSRKPLSLRKFVTYAKWDIFITFLTLVFFQGF